MLTPQVEFSHLFGIDALSMYNSYCNFVFLCFIYLLCPDRREGGNKRWFCLSVRPSVCLSVCSSVAYIANNSRTQRPSVHKFGRKVPHLRCDSHTSFKVKRFKVRVRGGREHTVSAKPGGHTACFLPIFLLSCLWWMKLCNIEDYL